MSLKPILIVDDESDMRSALCHALNRSGFKVESACCGSEALSKIEKQNFSLLITDVKMPEMSGMELLGAVKESVPQMPVIMITAHGTIHNAVEAMQQGAIDYILKPFSVDTLETTVKNVIARSNGNGKSRQPSLPADADRPSCQIITQDAAMLRLFELAKNVAPSHATILIQGESGTGKELMANFIHEHSGRQAGSYIAINCAALPDTLAESELFGHEKGAFTGAVSRKIGKFELAKGGTLVLDEISEMPIPLQAKLLRVLQEKEIDRVGGSLPIAIDTRVIAISNVDLQQAVAEKKFREDLYYRINVVPLVLPPLRDRKRDIPLLTEHFLQKHSRQNAKGMSTVAKQTLSLLAQQEWKGNIRELENTIERAVLVGSGDVLLPEHIALGQSIQSTPKAPAVSVQPGRTVREMEKELILSTLAEVEHNRKTASELLGISIRTLRNKLKEYKEEAALQ